MTWCAPCVLVVLMLVQPALPAIAAGLAVDLNEQVIRIPVTLPGSPQQVAMLEATLYRPHGSERFPLIVLNHGSPRDGAQRRAGGRARYPAASLEFVLRGFVVVIPMRRGFAGSEGEYAESAGSCAERNYFEAGLRAAEDVHATVQFMQQQPFIDARRIIVAGQSAGGFATLALLSRGVDGVVAGISFAGGRGSISAGQVCQEQRLVEAVARYGAASRVPTLWHYAENDSYFGPALVRRMHEAYLKAGGQAKLVMQPPFGADGHQVFSRESGRAVWLPEVDQFLEGLGLLRPQPSRGSRSIEAGNGL